MEAKGQLVDIGEHKYGMLRIRFSRCNDCGAEYPWATSMKVSGEPLDYDFLSGTKFMDGPMCNGKRIDKCLCVTDPDGEKALAERISQHEHYLMSRDDIP